MECEDGVFTIIGGLSLFLEQVVQSTEESEAICSMKMGYDECIADHVLSYVGGMSLFLEEGLSSSDEMFQAVFACHENTFSFAMVDVSAEDTVFEFLPSWRHVGFSPGITIVVSEILQHCSSRDHLSVHWEFAGLQPLRGSLDVVLNCTSLWPTEEMDRLSIPWDPGGSRFACWLLDTKHFATYIVVSFMNQLLHFYVWENGKSAVHAIELYVQWGPRLIENVLMVAMFVQLAQKSVDLPVLYIQVIKELCDYTIAGNNTGYSMHNLLMDSIVWLGGHGLVAELGGVWKITNNGVTYWSSAVQLPLCLKLEMHATLNMDTGQPWNQMVFSTFYHCWPLGSSSNETNNMYWHLQVQEEPCNCRNLCSFFGVSKYLEYKQWDPGIGQKDLECFVKQYQQILAAKFQGCSEYICAALLPTVSTSYKWRHYCSFSASGYYVQYKQEIEAFMESTFMHCLGTSNVSWGGIVTPDTLGKVGLGFMGRQYRWMPIRPCTMQGV